jgi:hypothetical protein
MMTNEIFVNENVPCGRDNGSSRSVRHSVLTDYDLMQEWGSEVPSFIVLMQYNSESSRSSHDSCREEVHTVDKSIADLTFVELGTNYSPDSKGES